MLLHINLSCIFSLFNGQRRHHFIQPRGREIICVWTPSCMIMSYTITLHYHPKCLVYWCRDSFLSKAIILFSPFSDSATRSCHQGFVNCISFVQLVTVDIVFCIYASLYMQQLKQLVYKGQWILSRKTGWSLKKPCACRANVSLSAHYTAVLKIWYPSSLTFVSHQPNEEENWYFSLHGIYYVDHPHACSSPISRCMCIHTHDISFSRQDDSHYCIGRLYWWKKGGITVYHGSTRCNEQNDMCFCDPNLLLMPCSNSWMSKMGTTSE